MFVTNGQPLNPFKIDQSQARRHLEYLGYKLSENVYLRFFYHSEDPRKNGDKGRKLDRLRWKDVENYQQDGRGVYVVVNGAGGGHEDKDIKQCVAIFCEWDDRPVEEQLQYWETVGFFEPTFTIYSGGKSAHPYWIFDELLGDIEQWRELQKLLIEVMDADPANKNPSRVFRLAGGWHIKQGREPVQAEFVQESGKKYSQEQVLEKLREIRRQQQQPQVEQPTLLIGQLKPPQQPYSQQFTQYEDIVVPVPESVPLESCLSKDSRSLLQSGVGKGARSDNGYKLAADLIGTANYLQNIGQRFDGDPWQLFLDYCHRCSSGNGWGEGEWKNIWKSAQKDCPTPSCKSDGVDNCIRAWYWNNYIKLSLPERRDRTLGSTACGNNKRSGPGGGNPPVLAVSLRDRILEILNRNHLASERKAAFIELAGSTGRQLREVEQLAEAIESEIDLAEGRKERVAELNQLLSVGDRRLTLSRYLHPHLAHPLDRLATWMGVDSESLLTVLLPTAASLLHPETRVIVRECSDFVEPMVFYTGIVSESGNRKSPTFKAITKSLRKFQDEEDIRYTEAQKQYKEDLAAWKRDKSEDKGEQPESPLPPREYFVDNLTSEALDRIKAQQPGHGILIRKDELSGLFGSYGAYKGGKGSDKEGILSGWNGDGVKVNRASGSRLSLSHDASSIAGAIQPGKLRKIMGDLEDDQGEWARFLWYYAPLKPFRLPENNTRFEVGDLLEGVYQKLDKLAPIQYRFTPDAQSAYHDWHWKLEQRKCAELRQGMRAAIAKMQGYTARLAGILHILWAIASGESPSPYIPKEQVLAARNLAEFYLGQVQLIHADSEAASGELNPLLSKILEKARQLGQLPARIAKTSIKALRSIKTDKILEYFRELEAMGYARVEGKTLIPQNVDHVDQNVDQMLTTPVAAKTIDNTLLQPIVDQNVDHVDHVDPFLEQEQNQTIQEHLPGDCLLSMADSSSTLNSSQQSQQVNNSAENLTQQSVDCVDQRSTSGSTFSNKSPKDLAAQILQCQTWVAVLEAMDVVSAIRKTSRDMVFEIVVTKHLNKDDRQHLVCLLANHIQQFPQDQSAYNWLPRSCWDIKEKAIAAARRNKGGIS